MQPQQWARITKILNLFDIRVSILYGSSECQIVIGCHLFDLNHSIMLMGRPLPDVHCLLIHEQGHMLNQKDNTNEIGEIYIGGEKQPF